MSIPYIRVTFLASAEVIKSEVAQESCEEVSNLACLIHLCPEEFLANAIMTPGDDLTSTIRPFASGKTIDHWTIGPSSPILWLHRLSKEYSIIVWLDPSIARKSWNSISSLFCMFISYFLHFLVCISPIYFPKKMFLFYHYQA